MLCHVRHVYVYLTEYMGVWGNKVMTINWSLLERWDVICGILGGIVLLVSGIHWLLKWVNTSLLTDTFVWALIGEADKTKLFSTVENIAKWLLALTLWAIIGMVVATTILGFQKVVFNGLGFGINELGEWWRRLLTIGAIGGAAFRALWPGINFVYKRYLQVPEQESTHSN